MTINKLSLSVATAALVATSAIAGNLTATSKKLGSEKLSLQDVNVSNVTVGANAAYEPTDIPAGSLKNPIFKFAFGNAKDVKVTDSAKVYEVRDGNESNITAPANLRLVAKDPVVSGSNNEVISFNADSGDTYVYNNRKYVILDDNTTGSADINVTVTKGATTDMTLKAALYSGDSQAENDYTTATSLYSIAKEYSATITKAFDARIDAAQSFKKFYDQAEDKTDTGDKTKDTLTLKIKKDGDVVSDGQLTVTSKNLIVFSDQNLTAMISGRDDSNLTISEVNDYNITATVDNTDVDAILELQTDGTKEIKKTSFGADVYLISGTEKFSLINKTASNAGKWSIYGYNAQIPNVAGLSTHDTVMKFSNRSGLDTDIYFTLIDPDGTVATLNSVDNSELASLPANSTGKYVASELLALVTDAEFNKTGSISVEVSVPTTPDSVYGHASFKNVDLGQFKDLPVYNSSNMNY